METFHGEHFHGEYIKITSWRITYDDKHLCPFLLKNLFGMIKPFLVFGPIYLIYKDIM
jgi:hypothetical protein